MFIGLLSVCTNVLSGQFLCGIFPKQSSMSSSAIVLMLMLM